MNCPRCHGWLEPEKDSKGIIQSIFCVNCGKRLYNPAIKDPFDGCKYDIDITGETKFIVAARKHHGQTSAGRGRV